MAIGTEYDFLKFLTVKQKAFEPEKIEKSLT